MLRPDEHAQLMRLAHEHDELPANEGDLKVWWIPQVPGTPFERRVANLEEAAVLLDALAAYDAFQLVHNIKGDYANMGGLVRYEEGEWIDWESPDGEDFEEWRREQTTIAA